VLTQVINHQADQGEGGKQQRCGAGDCQRRSGTSLRSRPCSSSWGLVPGNAQLVTQGKDEPVQDLQKAVTQTVEKLVLAQQSLQTGLTFWGRSLLGEGEIKALRERLGDTKTFLESLHAYSTPGKLKNFRHDAQKVNNHRDGLKALAELQALQDIVAELGTQASYLK